jgi:hypothetical protein
MIDDVVQTLAFDVDDDDIVLLVGQAFGDVVSDFARTDYHDVHMALSGTYGQDRLAAIMRAATIQATLSTFSQHLAQHSANHIGRPLESLA